MCQKTKISIIIYSRASVKHVLSKHKSHVLVTFTDIYLETTN